MPPPAASILKRERGNLCLAGTDIDFVGIVAADAALKDWHLSQDCVANRIVRDGVHQHMTLLSRNEISYLVEKVASDGDSATALYIMLEDDELTEPKNNTMDNEMNKKTRNMHLRVKVMRFCELFLEDRTTRTQDWFIHGIGRQGELQFGEGEKNWCFFLVCSYPRAAALRKKLGLAPKDFHITLGFNERDIHACSKGVNTLLRKQPHSITGTADRIISKPTELVELARTAILGGKSNEKMHRTEETDNTYIRKGMFHYATVLIGAAEGMISAQKFQRKPIFAYNVLVLLELLGNNHRELTLLLNILEMKCQILGRAQDFKNVVTHADLWVDILENVNSLEDTTRTNLKSIALGYKGVATCMNKQCTKAYPCLRTSYELYHQVKHPHGSKTRLAAYREKEAVSIERVLTQCCKDLGYDAPMPPLIPFPRTFHLFDTGGSAVSSDDLVLSEESPFFRELRKGSHVIVEEKIDGANLGFSLSGTGQILAQNRSHFVTEADHSQFGTLASWIHEHRKSIVKILSSPTDFEQRAASQGLILYGEWCAARHSIKYDKLPGYFVAFDLYDRLQQKFYSRERFHEILYHSRIPCAPVITKKTFGPYSDSGFQNIKADGMKETNPFGSDIQALLNTKSRFAKDGVLVEGVVLRIEDSENKWLEHRLKIVRPDFRNGILDHWSRRDVEKQIIDWNFGREYCSVKGDGYCESYCLAPPMLSEDVEESAFFRERTNPRKKITVILTVRNKDAVILPRNFSFLWKNEVALSSTPNSQEQIQAWKDLFHTSLVITLTEEQPLPESWFQQVESCRNLFVPVPNYEAPSRGQMDKIIDAIEETVKEGDSVVVHCGGGKGRAGTVGACLLLRYGSLGIRASIWGEIWKAPSTIADLPTHFNSAAAIKFLRTTRPGSIETKIQESFVRQYSDLLWKRVILPTFGLLHDTIEHASIKQIEGSSRLMLASSKENKEETANHRLTKTEKRAKEEEFKSIQFAQRYAPRRIICMGLPGSGKSTFAKSLAKSYPPGNSWLVLNQDKLGRKECERLAKSCKTRDRVILDRCNLKASERASWLQKLNAGRRGDVCLVHFAADAETCTRRVEERANHETISFGRGRRIVAEMNEKLEPPTPSEAKRYHSVHVVHTFQEAEEVLQLWFGAHIERGHSE
mmetsp:Transcript_4416/g.10612  ORF Transcript_4416/g.10612 Transcript_4416/m.10612 type:complete len:1152 (-) Transcript_4416:225-3680(-)